MHHVHSEKAEENEVKFTAHVYSGLSWCCFFNGKLIILFCSGWHQDCWVCAFAFLGLGTCALTCGHLAQPNPLHPKVNKGRHLGIVRSPLPLTCAHISHWHHFWTRFPQKLNTHIRSVRILWFYSHPSFQIEDYLVADVNPTKATPFLNHKILHFWNSNCSSADI